MKKVTPQMEIRHLPRPVVSELGNILQVDHTWKDIMGMIPENLGHHEDNDMKATYFPKYSSEDIRLVADECGRDGRTGLEVLIEEWGTSGRIRPKVSDLLRLLKKAELERAASYLDTIVCGRSDTETLEEQAFNNFELVEDVSIPCMSANLIESSSQENNNDSPGIRLEGATVPVFPYEELVNAIKTGSKIGEGAFGSVYKARLTNRHNQLVAIKILSEIDQESKLPLKKENLFKTEVEVLSKCYHKNIIRLEGYSFDRNSGNLGLVYEYMENGSLHDRIACLHSTPPLPWKLRLNISEGIAEGIVYLHTTFEPPLVHRDIKSPNILLDQNFTPKLGDFGIVRLGAHGRSVNTVINTTAVGTVMYMSPEALRGDVSVKMDTFSFAVVILELLTGLPFFDEEKGDILSYVQEFEENEITLLDSSAGDWNTSIGRELFDFAETCTKDKKDRPNMVQALTLLRDILGKV